MWWPAVYDKFYQAARLCRSDRAIVTRTWEQQAADALPGPGRHPHQSQSVAFAVRAAEAFAPFNSSHSHAAEADAPLSASPHPDRTAVCCQVRPACMRLQCCKSNAYALADSGVKLASCAALTRRYECCNSIAHSGSGNTAAISSQLMRYMRMSYMYDMWLCECLCVRYHMASALVRV